MSVWICLRSLALDSSGPSSLAGCVQVGALPSMGAISSFCGCFSLFLNNILMSVAASTRSQKDEMRAFGSMRKCEGNASNRIKFL